jgi:hypothetical protein
MPRHCACCRPPASPANALGAAEESRSQADRHHQRSVPKGRGRPAPRPGGNIAPGLGQNGRVLIVRATKKLLERIGPPSLDGGEQSTTLMGQWYATAIFWKPQVALFVNEPTLLPVLMPLAPDLAGEVPAATGRGVRRARNARRGHR